MSSAQFSPEREVRGRGCETEGKRRGEEETSRDREKGGQAERKEDRERR